MSTVAQTRTGQADPDVVLDDFAVTVSATIRTVAWQGAYTGTDPSPQATSFWVGFFEDSGGAPVYLPFNGERRRALSGATYAIEQVNQRLDTVSRCPSVQCALFDYSVTLSTPFTVRPGRYWLWIQADLPGSSPAFWGWRRGLDDNLLSKPAIGSTILLWDLAFALR